MDGRSGRTVRRLRLPESPRHLSLAAPGGPVLVPAERANAIVEVSLPGGRVRTTRVGRFPHDAARASGRLFVGDELGSTLSVVERGRLIKTLPTPRQPGGVAATADRRHVGVVAVRARELEVFDARTLRSSGTVDVGIGPTHIAGGGGRFFVVDTRGGSLLEMRLNPRRCWPWLRPRSCSVPDDAGGGTLAQAAPDAQPRVLKYELGHPPLPRWVPLSGLDPTRTEESPAPGSPSSPTVC